MSNTDNIEDNEMQADDGKVVITMLQKMKFIRAIYLDQDLTPVEKIVAIALIDHSNDRRGFAWITVAKIAAKTGVGRSSVLRAIPKLEGVWFTVEHGKRDARNRNSNNRYFPIFERDAETGNVVKIADFTSKRNQISGTAMTPEAGTAMAPTKGAGTMVTPGLGTMVTPSPGTKVVPYRDNLQREKDDKEKLGSSLPPPPAAAAPPRGSESARHPLRGRLARAISRCQSQTRATGLPTHGSSSSQRTRFPKPMGCLRTIASVR